MNGCFPLTTVTSPRWIKLKSRLPLSASRSSPTRGRERFACSLSRVKFAVFSSSVETGESEESVPTEYHGPELEIGFNAGYLLDFLRAIPQDRVAFALKDQKSAGELRPSAEELKDKYRYVVMPMRI